MIIKIIKNHKIRKNAKSIKSIDQPLPPCCPSAGAINKNNKLFILFVNLIINKYLNYKVLTFKDIDRDYIKDMVTGEESKTGLPKSNVLYYALENNAWCCVRPSGTEPKIKLYFGVKGKCEKCAIEELENLKNEMVKLVKGE